MEIARFDDYEGMSLHAAALIRKDLAQKPDLSICLATGNSPAGTYAALVKMSASDPTLFERIKVVKLDEWGGLPMDAPETCEQYILSKFLRPLGIPGARLLGFASDPADAEAECARVQAKLDELAPLDLCVLGLGKNGHLGFNEPAPFLQAGCHVASLSKASMQHAMVDSADRKPRFGFTLGMRDILTCRRIILLVSGKGKEDATARLLSGKISTSTPATFLWLHPKVHCLINSG